MSSKFPDRRVTKILESIAPAIALVVVSMVSLSVSAVEPAASSQLRFESAEVRGEHRAINQAEAMRLNQELVEAETAYQTLIEFVEEVEGAYSKKLIQPLLGLGRTYRDQGRFDEAEQSYRRGQHILHRENGVLSVDQEEFLDELATLYLQQGKPLEADRQKRFEFYVNEHSHGEMNEDLIPALSDIAHWFAETGQYHQSRRSFNRIYKIIKDSQGESSIELIDPIRKLAKVKQLQGTCCAYKVLREAEQILAENNSVDDHFKAELFRDIGDAYLLHSRYKQAAQYYGKSWQLLDRTVSQEFFDTPVQLAMTRKLDDRRSRTETYQVDPSDPFGRSRLNPVNNPELYPEQDPKVFSVTQFENQYNVLIRDPLEFDQSDDETLDTIGQPVRFVSRQLETMLPGRFRNPDELAKLSITMEFTVDARGKATNIEMIESNAPRKLNRLMQEVIRKSRFRPRMVEGIPVATDEFTLVQDFPNEISVI